MIAHRHLISAGNNFGGVAPGGTGTEASNMKTFAASATGGLFDIGIGTPGKLVCFELVDGGQSSWSLTRVYADGSTGPVLYSGTSGDAVTNAGQDDVWLFPGQKLKLVTGGASLAFSAAVYFVPASED